MISAADRTRQAQAVAEVIDFMRKQKLSLDDLINVGDADLKSPDNLAAHPEDHGKVPLVELMTDSYHNNHGKQIFVPIFEIVGWVERPGCGTPNTAAANEDAGIDCDADCNASAIEDYVRHARRDSVLRRRPYETKSHTH